MKRLVLLLALAIPFLVGAEKQKIVVIGFSKAVLEQLRAASPDVVIVAGMPHLRSSASPRS